MIPERIYAALLRLYPRQFRERYGAGMRHVFLERYHDARKTGRGGAFVWRSFVDLAAGALLERTSAMNRWLHVPAWDARHAELLKERRPMFWQSTLMDVRFALRLAVRTPLFTSLAVAALALGIGANSAIFAVADGVLLEPLPYAAPEELVIVWSDNTRESRPEYPMSPANFLDYKRAARAVRQVEAMFSFITAATIGTDQGTEQVAASFVTPGMFPLLGRTAALGRAFTAGDLRGVIVLSDGFWARRFGRDPAVVGRQLVFNSQPVTVIGVMPASFVFPYRGMLGPTGFTTRLDADVWALLDETDPTSQFNDAAGRPQRSVHFLTVIARLAPGAGLAQARDEALAIARRLEAEFPASNAGLRANVVSAHEQTVGTARPAIALLATGVGFVLLLACINVANLMLSRSVARQKEMAVRAALGAGRLRLLRQTFTESMLLSAAGALVALPLAAWATAVLASLAPAGLPRVQDIGLEWRVLGFTAIVALAAGLMVGIVPALAAARADVQTPMKESGRSHSGGMAARRTRAVLAAAEVALAVLLTVGAGLLFRSFVALLAVDPGFRTGDLLTLQLTLPSTVTSPDARRAFYRELFARLESIPSVRSAGGTTRLPLGSTNVTSRLAVEGRSTAPGDMPEVEFRRAAHAYFQTMGIPLLRGREFDGRDGPGGEPAVLINDSLARRIFGGDDPVGRRVRIGPNPAAPWNTIIGVVGDVRHAGLDEAPAPELYVSALANPPVSPFIVLRTDGDPAAVADTVRRELKALDKDLAVYDMRTMGQIRIASVSERRFIMILASVFGMLALALAAIGVYGVMSLGVTERTQEMGVRLALGAAPRQVVGLVVRQGLGLAAAGTGIGLGAAVALTPLMASQLYGIPAIDPVTLASVPVVVLVVALVACVVPARRAMHVDPVTALRYE